MRRRPYRACLSLLLVFALLHALSLRAAMAMPMVQQGDAPQEHTQHAAGHVLHQAAPEPAASHTHQDSPPHCGVHCGLCGTCHSSVPAAIVSSVIGLLVIPAMSQSENLAEVIISPDPRPPRG